MKLIEQIQKFIFNHQHGFAYYININCITLPTDVKRNYKDI